ncbi:MAG TPA: helix-turn-helix transcriptional regulator [Solirubrobacteraceae bacterium]|jgi:transcriptional regulator with XRE-family HTH domain|nr:helix-turn-helix transcriptional regulator [Solirubrobacteraceae bacterium]
MSEPRTPTNKDLGRAIRRLRQDRNLSIRALARQAGMSTGHLGVIERGRGNPRLDKLFALSNALGVTFEVLVSAAEDEAANGGEA